MAAAQGMAAKCTNYKSKNDTVMVVKGRDRGKTGKVLRVLPDIGHAGGRAAEYGQAPFQAAWRDKVPAELSKKKRRSQIANVMIFCDRCNAPVRIGIKAAADGTSTRVCRRCGEAAGE